MTVPHMTRDVMPDHDGSDIIVTTPQGDEIGVLEFDKNTSKWTDLWDLPPHRRWPLKKKYRQR